MSQSAEPYAKTMTFAELNFQLTADEGLLGKLLAIKRVGDHTVAVFERQMPFPADRRVKLIKSDVAIPGDHKEVSKGDCWDAGSEIDCVAIRKKAS